MNKVIWIDTETTGLNSNENGIRELGCIIEIDHKIVDKFILYINPKSYKKHVLIDSKALEISNKTVEDLKKYPHSSHQFQVFMETIENYICIDDKKDKFQVAGFNTSFDIGFIRDWFKDNNNEFYSSYFSYQEIDVLAFARMLSYHGDIDVENHKLITLCEEFKIPLNAHNALDDIEATYKLNLLLNKI